MWKRNFDNVQINVEFETAEELRNLTSGESLNSALGKVDRAITEIKELQGSQAIAEYTVKRPGGKSKAIRLFTVELGRAYGESCGISILFNAHSTMTAKDQVGILHIGEISYIGDKPVGPCWLINGSPTVEYQNGYLRDIVKARVYSGNIEVWADASTTDNWDEVNYTLLGDPKNHVGDSAGLITFDNVTTDTLLDAMLGGYGLTLTLYPIDMAIIDGIGGTFEEVREEIASLKAVSGKQTSSSTASGGKNVYTITFADGSTSDLNVYNGAKGDKGDKGDTGTAATITIGTVTTGAAGSKASVTNAGTASAAKLNFTIPQGAQGDKGAAGKDGLTTAISIGGKKYSQVDGTITIPDDAFPVFDDIKKNLFKEIITPTQGVPSAPFKKLELIKYDFSKSSSSSLSFSFLISSTGKGVSGVLTMTVYNSNTDAIYVEAYWHYMTVFKPANATTLIDSVYYTIEGNTVSLGLLRIHTGDVTKFIILDNPYVDRVDGITITYPNVTTLIDGSETTNFPVGQLFNSQELSTLSDTVDALLIAMLEGDD